MDDAVAEVIVKLVGNSKFAAMIQEKVNSKADTTAIDAELADFEKQLQQYYAVKLKLAEEIDSLDPYQTPLLILTQIFRLVRMKITIKIHMDRGKQICILVVSIFI